MVGLCRLDGVKYVGEGCKGAIRELLGLGEEVEGEEEKPWLWYRYLLYVVSDFTAFWAPIAPS